MPEYKHARPRGFAPWKPSPATVELMAKVDAILVSERQYLPLTARQVFYRMVDRHSYKKTEASYASLCDKLNRARRAGLVSWDAIRDDKAARRGLGGFADVYSWRWWTNNQAEYFGLRPDLAQTCRVEVHVEARGMMPQVARVACGLGATVHSSGGFGSATTQFDSAKRFAERDVPTVVLSVGDFDPSGVSLYWSWRENVMAFFREGAQNDNGRLTDKVKCRTMPLFRRIAVTPDQIRQHGFTTAPAKKTDRRGDWRGETVQCEAIPSAMLERIVRDAIMEHYDRPTMERIKVLGHSLRPALTGLVGTLDIGDLDSETDAAVLAALNDLRDQGHLWTAGYANSDENDMEEGV